MSSATGTALEANPHVFLKTEPGRVDKWVGGQWMLNRKGEPIPLIAKVPNPLVERQFMVHDDGSGMPQYLIRGDRTKEEADIAICPPETLQRLKKNDERRILTDYQDEDRGKLDERIEKRMAEIDAANEVRTSRIKAVLAQREQDQLAGDVPMLEAKLARAKEAAAAKADGEGSKKPRRS